MKPSWKKGTPTKIIPDEFWSYTPPQTNDRLDRALYWQLRDLVRLLPAAEMTHVTGFSYPTDYVIYPRMPVTQELCQEVFAWTLEFPPEIRTKIAVWREDKEWHLKLRLYVDGPVLLKNAFTSGCGSILVANIVHMIEAQTYLRRDHAQET